MMNYQLLIMWQRSKNFIIETDNLFNTGLYKKMIIECTCTLIQPYPFFAGYQYEEKHMYSDQKATFELNNLFICFMFFFRIYFYVRSMLSMSNYIEPRSQRVCNIYGTDAGYIFSIKALMKESPWRLLGFSLLFSVFVFGYCLRLFERVI